MDVLLKRLNSIYDVLHHFKLLQFHLQNLFAEIDNLEEAIFP